MKGLRVLLRLEDKVAAEGRRLQNLGSGPSRWGGLTLLAAAAILHGAMLMLPALHVKATLPDASPVPDFPRVWRLDAEAPEAAAAQPPSSPPAARSTTKAPPPAPRAGSSRRPFSAEPVAEPVPDVAMSMIAAEIDENIPNPDAPPPALEPGPPGGGSAAAPAPIADDPKLVARAQPAYPVAARSLGAEGKVRLRVAILPDGRVDRAAVLDCSRPGVGFEAAAANAVKHWRYESVPPSSPVRSAVVTIEFKNQESGR